MKFKRGDWLFEINTKTLVCILADVDTDPAVKTEPYSMVCIRSDGTLLERGSDVGGRFILVDVEFIINARGAENSLDYPA